MTDVLFPMGEPVEWVPVDPGPLPSGPYDVVYADPPWRYSAATTTPTRRIEEQYPTMALEDICAMPVSAMLADNAVLFLWATAPLLPDCLSVMPAWGFTYKTCMVWDKERIGLGHWVRVQHELLLIGVHGKPTLPAVKNTRSVIREPRGPHSRKPDKARRDIEAMFPDARRIELFARMKTGGWDAWGNEA